MQNYRIEYYTFSENEPKRIIEVTDREVYRSKAIDLEINCLIQYYNRKIVVSTSKNGGFENEKSGSIHKSIN